MADYIYLLENRLSAAQQRAIRVVRDLARAEETTIFLTGGAVRDLTAGSAVRDLDLTVVGDAGPLRSGIEASGAIFTGENSGAKALYFLFPGGVRVEVSTALSVEFPKPGKPVYTAAGIIDDLRRRDFTANAMALSLNEGSYGLLMDPLNGVADIENRELRLISNYGFIEDPIRMVRAIRLGSRLGWQMEERTRQRYENAKAEDIFENAPKASAGYELEEIFHEEDPVRIMRALDAEGWLKLLSPQVAAAKPNETALADLREKQGQLLTQGVLADASALALPFLLGKSSAADIETIKKSFARSGFTTQVDSIEARTRELQTRFAGKEAAAPSAAWRMLHEAEPELVLSMLVNGKGAVQQRLKTFLNDSPSARQRIPYSTLQEMRITPDLPAYNELLDKLFFELMDGKLSTPEELKAYLEPYSPPAPPPPVNLRRARAKKEARPSRAKGKKAAAAAAEVPEETIETVAQQEEALGVAEGLMEPGTLTGPDRSTEPTIETPLEGKVAPLAPGETEPVPAKPVKTAKASKVLPEADSEAARKLSAKPAPVPTKQERAATTPHPQAAREVAGKRPVVIPSVAAAKSAPAKSGTAVAVKTPAKTNATPAKSAKAAPPSRQAAKVSSVPAKKSAASTKTSGGKKTPVPAKVAAKSTKVPSRKAAPPAKGAKQPAKQALKAPVKVVAKSSKMPARKAPPAKTAAKNAVAKTPTKKAPAKKVASRR